MPSLSDLLRKGVHKQFQICDYLFCQTHDVSTLERIYQQRHGVYLCERYIEPEAFPDGVFRDLFDSVAVHLAAFDAEGNVVGSSRVVPPTPLGLPIRQLFALPPFDVADEATGEVGRLAVNAPHRGHTRIVVTGLIAGIYQALRARGLSHFLAFMHPGLVRMLNALHIPVRPLCELAPGPRQQQARKLMAGYFARGGVLPTLCSLDEMDECLGI